VHARNFDKSKIKSLGWEAQTSLKEGIEETYQWIEEQVRQFERKSSE
jgi:nucleoside-diphosphate-sugar epimerase